MADSKDHTEPMPFVAPCRQVGLGAPWRWLTAGINDIRRAPLASLGYGLIMAAMIMFVALMAWKYGSAWIMFSLLCGFVFMAPLACIGTYAISAQLERNTKPSLRRTLRACFRLYIGNQLVFTLVLLIIFLVWARASSVTSIFLPSSGTYELAELTGYLSMLAIIAFIFLGITFAASVFALPMIMHRDVDAITAVITSVNAVMRNKMTMLIWALMIATGIVVGVLTAGLGLIVFLPAVGHAAWHGYLETIDASGFPRHKIGITASERPSPTV